VAGSPLDLVHVDADHAAGRADAVRDLQRHVAAAAAEIESHVARADTDPVQERRRRRGPGSRENLEPVVPLPAATDHITLHAR
jgi:hypothetical protein